MAQRNLRWNVKLKWAIQNHSLEIVVAITLFSAILLGILIYLQVAEWPAILAILGSSFSFIYFIQQQQLEEARLMKDLIVDFNRRYDELNECLNVIVKLDSIDSSHEKKLDDYFNLCSEEYLFYKRGFVYPEVWDSWVKGMEFFWNNKFIREKWWKETIIENNNQAFNQYYKFNAEAHFSESYKQAHKKEHTSPNKESERS